MLNIKELDLPELEAADVRDEYIYYESDSSDFRFQMAEDEAFYLGQQLTDAQKQYLNSVGQPAESNNKIRPSVEQVLSNIAGTNPEWDIEPIGQMDGGLAKVYNQLVDKVWRDSDGDVQFRKCCKDFLVKGVSYLYVYPDYQADKGLGAIRVKNIKPESVFVDPNAALPDFSDATSLIISDLHTKESLKISFPDFADEIDDAEEDFYRNEISSGNYNKDQVYTPGDVGNDSQPKCRKFIRFAKVSVPKALITESASGKYQVFDKDGYKEIAEDSRYQKLIDEGAVTEDIIYDTLIRETCIIGDMVYYDEVHPISEYPIIPACNEHTGTPYPAGDVRHAKSPQRMLNRTEALIIAHTNATTNFKLVVEDGAIDPGELQKWNIPNAVIRANPGALRENKIKEFAPPAVSSQLFSEKQRYEMDIEQVFGAYKYLQGLASESPGTVGEAQIVEEAVSRKQNWKVLPIYDMLTRAGKVAVQWVPWIYSQERVLRLVDDYGQYNEVIINQAYIQPETGNVERMFDLVSNTVDISVVIGSTKSKSPAAELQKDLQLMSAGILDRTQVILNMSTDMDKQGLIARFGEIGQLQSQLSQAQEQLEQAQGDLQTRERELFHSNMRAEVSEATKKVHSATEKVKARAEIEQQKQKGKTQRVAEDLVNAKNTVNSDEQQAPLPPGVG
tara:strand:- start:5333 stop:7354 length:2022 start_codon:yes stop_codon:yes gene_type:complete